MRCPACAAPDTRVLDTRPTADASAIRRRRFCDRCDHRFTTYERTADTPLLVRKSDGRLEPFQPAKIRAGVLKAISKRPVPEGIEEEIAQHTELTLRDAGLQEAPSQEIGRLVMEALKAADEVAYLRFASVHQDFKDAEHFVAAAEQLSGPTRTQEG